MKVNAFDILVERGFIAQCTHADELREAMSKGPLTFYMGYDPTADSLTAGHLLTLMAHAHLQRGGHRLITLMGTGTGMIGDPSDRTGMRNVATRETVEHNIACFKKQFERFVEYGEGKAIMEDNDWLLELNLVAFMREFGVHFSVNRMLAAECYKSRLASGLTAFEFTYMLLQAYDFLELYRRYGCRLQIGGNDQWSNIIAGVELTRKVEGVQTYGLTLNLLTTHGGEKMGKTAGNAIWLSADKTSPYDFYQYWRNVDDESVIKNLKLLTFLSMEEIEEMASWTGAELNRAKDILAFEITKTVHGEDEAEKSQKAAKGLFEGEGDLESMPTTEILRGEIGDGITILDLLNLMGIIPSRAEGRRLIAQGGIKVNSEKIESHDHVINVETFSEGTLIVQKGKKIFHRGRLT